jgi:hypothetical protein
MKLLDEIIDLLSDQKGSLTDALLKTKVVMHKIGHTELTEWVNDELNGYPLDKEVPPYRVIPSRLYGNLRDVGYMYNNHAIPTGHLSQKMHDYFNVNKMRESVAVLEEYASKTDMHLTSPVPPEYYKKLGEALAKGIWIDRAWIQTEPTQVMSAIVEVRSRLLDFALGLQDQLGDIDESEVKNAAKSIDATKMFHNAVFGDNTTIVMGDGNRTTVRNSVKKGDFESLAAVLKHSGVTEEDIGYLQIAIQEDEGQVDTENEQTGPAVKRWLSNMMDKAINTAWNIELGVAAGLLTNALQAYYFR